MGYTILRWIHPTLDKPRITCTRIRELVRVPLYAQYSELRAKVRNSQRGGLKIGHEIFHKA